MTLTIKGLERRLRSMKTYADWVSRNRAAWCFQCNGDQDLECHHIVTLYHILLGLWKLYGDREEVLRHAESMHQDDRVECVTLCSKCHGNRHPGRIASKSATEIRGNDWVAVPRNWWFGVSHSTKDTDGLGLVALQTMFGLGWYILNGRMEGRMVTFNRRRFAELIGKTPGTSFANSFDSACNSLQAVDILAAYHLDKNDVELHISPDYIQNLVKNPWFFSLNEIPSGSMCELMLRWFLSHQSRRRTYPISLAKLASNLGIRESKPSKRLRMVEKACDTIPWAKMTHDDGQCQFEIKKRSAIPIFTLREMLNDCLLD